jgi:hypothetical protein
MTDQERQHEQAHQQGPRSQAGAVPEEGENPRQGHRGPKFNTLRWAMVWFTQIIFYGACWLNWESNGV